MLLLLINITKDVTCWVSMNLMKYEVVVTDQNLSPNFSHLFFTPRPNRQNRSRDFAHSLVVQNRNPEFGTQMIFIPSKNGGDRKKGLNQTKTDSTRLDQTKADHEQTMTRSPFFLPPNTQSWKSKSITFGGQGKQILGEK